MRFARGADDAEIMLGEKSIIFENWRARRDSNPQSIDNKELTETDISSTSERHSSDISSDVAAICTESNIQKPDIDPTFKPHSLTSICAKSVQRGIGETNADNP